MTTTDLAATAAHSIQITAGKDHSTHCSRTFEVTLWSETLTTGANFKTRQAAGKAGQKVAHKLVVGMLEGNPAACQIVRLASATRAFADAKKWEAWKRSADTLQIVTAAFLAA